MVTGWYSYRDFLSPWETQWSLGRGSRGVTNGILQYPRSSVPVSYV
jgi:hypothetical protein